MERQQKSQEKRNTEILVTFPNERLLAEDSELTKSNTEPGKALPYGHKATSVFTLIGPKSLHQSKRPETWIPSAHLNTSFQIAIT